VPLFALAGLSASAGGHVALAAPGAPPKEFFRKDYKPSDFSIPDIYLSFDLSAEETIVTTTSKIVPSSLSTANLVLDGEADSVTLLSPPKIDGVELPASSFEVTGEGKLSISAAALPSGSKPFSLETRVKLCPAKNLALSGLYSSGSNLLCTQCEAMGFRRITYHLDRPDVLTKYKVRLEADKATFPLLLSNGNQLESGDVAGSPGRHFSLWEDPFPKPSYLFALVAGDLGGIHSTYKTTSGRDVRLGIYSDKENAGKLQHAMYSLKESLKWDEDTFGLECDLDVYNVVATNDFNMGAMENKGLNIFNSAYVLADPSTATDTDYERILGVIGHEYFHNWTGNRVTVRDWFQLTLKEGLTVFRDQWFSSDLTSNAVKRVEDVRGLRGRQFVEDQGPMAHPIRPESYISMDNFYTGTVYVKGAEVVRMYRTILGEEGFKKGMKLYFERHDGGAVTCDDFRAAMADANGRDLAQFEHWYSQAGTPIVNVQHSYDAASKIFSITLKQHTPSTPGQDAAAKKPLMIPVVVGLLSATTGAELVPSTTLLLSEAEQTFTFPNVAEQPIPSIFRDFSAPVKVVHAVDQTDAELAFLMAHDTDAFNKWDAGNRLATRVVLSLAAKKSTAAIEASQLPKEFVEAVRTVLTTCKSGGEDPSLVAYSLQLPDEMTLAQDMAVVDVDALHAARKHVKASLANALKGEFEAVYQQTASAPSAPYVFSAAEVGRRRLRNTVLDFLSAENDKAAAVARAKAQYDGAQCMTEQIAALGSLVSKPCPEREAALADFHKKAAGDALVLNKWFAIQAMADLPDLLSAVLLLKKHPDFLLSNPNRARSLISTFAGNQAHFHAGDGKGYAFIADCVLELDKLNPQVASRLATSFSQWRRFDEARQALMKAQLERIKATEGLSKDTYEVVLRSLK
jgi:aminopeptidase N